MKTLGHRGIPSLFQTITISKFKPLREHCMGILPNQVAAIENTNPSVWARARPSSRSVNASVFRARQ